MMQSTRSTVAEPTLDLGALAPSSPVGGIVYDTLGMPMSVRAAQAMPKSSVEAALARTLAKLHHETGSSGDMNAPIDSMEVIFLIGRFYRGLNQKALDLSKVSRARWSTLEGVADVLHEVMQELS